MQLINSTIDQKNQQIDQQVLNVLVDIAKKTEIQSNFCISHPDYKLPELQEEAIERLRKMPESMQYKYISLQLQNFLYGTYYSGAMRSALALNTEEGEVIQDLENSTSLGVDIEFYNHLHNSNHGTGYFDQGWVALQEEVDGRWQVRKDDLKIYIKREQHLKDPDRNINIGDLLDIRFPKNRVQNGFYVAISNSTHHYHGDQSQKNTLVRVYFNLTPAGAVAVMGNLTKQLNQSNLPFKFKALYNPKEYERYDSAVLYFPKENYLKINDILEEIYRENKTEFKADTTLFSMKLAPGLGLAEEPDQKFSEQESFGMNRCQIVANGLITAWQRGEILPERRVDYILEQFQQLGISLHQPYLNANSKNIYHNFS